eukprot:gene40351-53332_t
MTDPALGLPASAPGMRIGLFGGSFNPPHDGHRLVALECLKRLALDRVWILVSPGNPLKDHSELAPLATRMTETRRVMDHPALEVTGFEAGHHFTYTYQTLSFLRQTQPATDFVWIMGADSLMSFDRWEHWQDIAGLMPMAVYARPGATFRATRSTTRAKVLADPRRRDIFHPKDAAALEEGDVILVEVGDVVPTDGEVIEGVASVDESAITGESAPVIRESGGDRSSVTGGTRLVSDWLVVKVTARPGETFLDKMIALVEGAKRQKTPNEIALDILLAALTLVFLFVVVSLPVFAIWSGTQIP